MGFMSPKVSAPPPVEPEKPEDVVDPLQEQRMREQRRMGRLSTILSMGSKLSDEVSL